MEKDYGENLFKSRVAQTDDGRYITPIPWTTDGSALGPSYKSASEEGPVPSPTQSPAATALAPAQVSASPHQSSQTPADVPLRRSRRIQNRNVHLVTTVLLLWLSLVPSVPALFIQPLEPGIHAQATRNVSVSTFELNFLMRTNLNTTHDSNMLHSNIQDLKTFCDSLAQPEIVNISTFCHSLADSLAQESRLAISFITSTATRTRSARAIPAVAAQVLAMAKAALPHVLTTGYIIYQEVKISRLEAQLDTLNDRLKKVAYILAKSTDIESEAVAQVLNDLIRHQQLQQLQTELTDYAANIQAHIQETILRYESVTAIRPYEALRDYVENHQPILGGLQLPPHSNTDDLFTYEPARVSIENNIVLVSFIIPLVTNLSYTEYQLISIPGPDGTAILLENHDWHQLTVFDTTNATYFAPTEPAPLDRPVYRRHIARPVTLCLRDILVDSSPNNSLRACGTKNLRNLTDFFRLGEEDWGVLLTNAPQDIEITCQPNQTTTVTFPANLLHFSGCQIFGKSFGMIAAVTAEADVVIEGETNALPPVPIQHIQPYHIDARLKELRSELIHTFDEPLPDATFGQRTDIITIIAIIVGSSAIAVTLIIWFVFLRYRHQRHGRRSTDDSESSGDIPMSEMSWSKLWTAWKASATDSPAPTIA